MGVHSTYNTDPSQVVISFADNYVDMVVEVNLTILLSLTTL